MSVFDKGLITILACNAVFSLMSIPLIFRWVPRNSVYGYRTRATLADDSLWYKANAYFGLSFFVASFLSACLAMAIDRWQGLTPQSYLKVSVLLLVAPVVAAVLLTGRFVRVTGAGSRLGEN